ncbi:hypothetical protein LUW76_26375 [Actinomadura madurae]|uniref:hypothetical protein n=1 Tax=Actinomadura madurae TaxID=1993 RepID=UPI0020269AEF|nr:hypothetical protein [Actinomadura madurae]URM97603.1 hypothetical protein LUW76_26375 [Actinomadura madurae]URN08293.1 hypothetical protein LUW74_36265 [Actinomadura madurae]
MLPSNPNDRPSAGNQVNVGAWGNIRSTQIAGGDINVRKRNIRVGLAGLAALTVFGGGSVVILNVQGGEAPLTYEEGMTPDEVKGIGSSGGEKGARQTAVIYLQAAVAGDAATACELVSADARAKRFALRGCDSVVLEYAERIADSNRPGTPGRWREALGKASTTMRMRGTGTAEVIVRPSGIQPVSVTVARQDDRWRVIGTSITGLGLD